MLLPGRLELTTLGDVLGILHRGKASGALELVEPGGAIHRVHLVDGAVSAVETPLREALLGEVLAEMGALSEVARRAVDTLLVEQLPRPIGLRLVEKSFISRETLDRALRLQTRRRLGVIARLGRARINFRPRAKSRVEPMRLGPKDFLVGLPRLRQKQQGATQQPSPSRVQALAVLGLGPDADENAVRVAFRRLAHAMHPDRGQKLPQTERERLERAFARASAAYHTLVA